VDQPNCGTSEFNLGNQEEVKADENCNLASDRVGPVITSSLEKEQSVKSSSGVSVQAEGGRCIKYTFNRRKRKNVSVDSTSQGAVPEKSSSLVSLADKQESRTKPGTQNILVESPRGNNHLVNIAQQVCAFIYIFGAARVHLCLHSRRVSVVDKLILFCSSLYCQG
jgi:hypothetical protein